MAMVAGAPPGCLHHGSRGYKHVRPDRWRGAVRMLRQNGIVWCVVAQERAPEIFLFGVGSWDNWGPGFWGWGSPGVPGVTDHPRFYRAPAAHRQQFLPMRPLYVMYNCNFLPLGLMPISLSHHLHCDTFASQIDELNQTVHLQAGALEERTQNCHYGDNHRRHPD